MAGTDPAETREDGVRKDASGRYDLVIIGGGVSAFGAAVYAGRFELRTLVVGESFGGAIILTNSVENYPGFPSISGDGLFRNVKEHAMEYGIDVLEEKVVEVLKSGEGFEVRLRDRSFFCSAILFATGSEWRKLGVPGEKEHTGNGVHYCALCDGYIYKDRTVAVIGGSDSAAKEALLLADYAKKVYIIYRKESIRAEPINQTRVRANPKIEVINNTNVTEIVGVGKMDKVLLDREYKGFRELALDAVFIDIGHVPISYLTKKLGVRLNEKGEIVVARDASTNVPGVYAAGDVTDMPFKQVITGVAQGVSAVYSIYHLLGHKG